jgi:hypothetical protein
MTIFDRLSILLKYCLAKADVINTLVCIHISRFENNWEFLTIIKNSQYSFHY